MFRGACHDSESRPATKWKLLVKSGIRNQTSTIIPVNFSARPVKYYQVICKPLFNKQEIASGIKESSQGSALFPIMSTRIDSSGPLIMFCF